MLTQQSERGFRRDPFHLFGNRWENSRLNGTNVGGLKFKIPAALCPLLLPDQSGFVGRVGGGYVGVWGAIGSCACCDVTGSDSMQVASKDASGGFWSSMIKVLKKIDFTSENKYLHHPSSHLPLPSKTPIPSTFPQTRPSNPVWAADFRYTSQDWLPVQSEPLTGFLIKHNFRLSRFIKVPAHSYTQYYCYYHITVAL